MFPETFNPNSTFAGPKQGKFPSYALNQMSQKSAQKLSGMQKPAEGVIDFMDSTTVTHSSLVTEPIKQNAQDLKAVIQHLVLENFKLKACPFNIQHNHKSCPFYHNSKDKKRPGNFFTAEICEYAEREENCPNGDLCQKSHNRVEQLYRADKYKTKFCSFYPNYLEKCEYGIFCSFAHNENDILVELIHNLVYDDDFFMFKYKTVWCPFNLTQHDKSLCVYAHNWQDYRRSPHMYHYEPNPCPNWKSNDFVINYNEGCSNNFACTKCHGWKEHEFHPLNYKIKLCPAGKNCTKGRDCSYYHNEIDRRVLSQEIAYNVFKYFPKNRIITNTFKTLVTDPNPNNDSAEIVFTNVNNPWERREISIQNENFHSLTDSNLLNLYDNNEHKESNDSGHGSAKIKPSFSMTNLDSFMLANNPKMKQEEGMGNLGRQEIVYPNETWNQKKNPAAGAPSKYSMVFSQPLFDSKSEIRQFLNLEEEQPVPANMNRSFNQSPAQNMQSMKNTGMPLQFGITAPPNLKKIHPVPLPQKQMAPKGPLNNTPNVMNQINQVRAGQPASITMPPQLQFKPNQGSYGFNDNSANSVNSLTSIKNSKSANSFNELSQPIQMSFQQSKPVLKQHKAPQQSTLPPPYPKGMPQNMMFFNNNVNIINENMGMMDPEPKNQRFSMNVINKSQKEIEKPHFNLNVNSQPFNASYSFSYSPNNANMNMVNEGMERKSQSKIGMWTNKDPSLMNKVNSQVNLSKNFGSYEFEAEEKRIKSDNNSPLLERNTNEEIKLSAKNQKLDCELEKKLSLERESEKYSEAQINNILKNICEEEYEDKN